jgi:hypothetical protein
MKKILLTTAVVGMLCSFITGTMELPKSWFKAGSKPESYDMGLDRAAYMTGKSSATIKSIDKEINGFGTLMQNCLPTKYAGKRVRMSGFMKSDNVQGWAGLWFRVDQHAGSSTAFDNMQDRSVKGTTDWKKYEIVLDVSSDASNLAYGALLAGTGQIWFADLKFEIVDNTVATTGTTGPVNERKVQDEPTNLDFAQ